jgi:NET1-associated nuclear protein 1 (U3 small nucleolar RNA-associated protein 17)
VGSLLEPPRLQIDLDTQPEVSWTSRSSFSLRSDIPKHTSWSHDGSLLAIPIGSSVVLYDPNTNAVQQSFVTQECRQPFEAHFIGRNGRYLAIMGGVDLVVWDVLSQSGTLHFKLAGVRC